MKLAMFALTFVAAACSSTGASAPPTFVCSPHGEVNTEAKAFSPDAQRFAKLIAPTDAGRIGIFDAASGEQLSVLEVTQHPEGDFPNGLKAMAWDAGGGRIAAMFHHRGSRLGGAGHVSVVTLDTSHETLLPIQREGRCVRFTRDGVSVDGEAFTLRP